MRQSFARLAWLLTGVLASTALMAAHPAAGQLFSTFSRDTHNILEGNWQSCRDADGRYSERVYDHIVNGIAQFEVHLGPREEFAILKGVQDVHRDHASTENLLSPYRVVTEGGRAKQRWDVPSLNVVFTVTLAGGSRSDCESWFILLEPLRKPTH